MGESVDDEDILVEAGRDVDGNREEEVHHSEVLLDNHRDDNNQVVEDGTLYSC